MDRSSDRRLTDEELVERGRLFEELERLPAWEIIKAQAKEKEVAIKESLVRVPPTDSAQIASLQAQARECRYWMGFVNEQIERGKQARDRIVGRENRYGKQRD